MSNSGRVSLGDLCGKPTILEIACSRCDRSGLLRLDRLIAEHGVGMGLPVLGDCPRINRPGIYERCGVGFPQLPGLFLPRK